MFDMDISVIVGHTNYFFFIILVDIKALTILWDAFFCILSIEDSALLFQPSLSLVFPICYQFWFFRCLISF